MKMNHEYQKKIVNESGITNIEIEIIPLPSSMRRAKTAF